MHYGQRLCGGARLIVNYTLMLNCTQMQLTADVCGGDHVWPSGTQRGELARTQFLRKHRLQHRIGARGTTAQVRVGDCHEFVAGSAQ